MGITIRLAGALVALALVPLGVAESACYTTSTPEFQTPVGVGPHERGVLYYDEDYCYTPTGQRCYTSFWIYEETNGIAGLQRDDEVHSDVSDCGGAVAGDTVIY